MTIYALREDLLINNDGLGVNETSLGVTFITRHSGMAALEGEMRPSVMVEGGRNPALSIVAIGARGFASFSELACVRVFVTILTNLRRALELDFLLADRNFVAGGALDGAVRAEQRKFCF